VLLVPENYSRELFLEFSRADKSLPQRALFRPGTVIPACRRKKAGSGSCITTFSRIQSFSAAAARRVNIIRGVSPGYPRPFSTAISCAVAA